MTHCQKSIPFIESRQPVVTQHAQGAVRRSPVDAATGVHEASLDDVDRWRHHRCAESGAERRHKMTANIIWKQTTYTR